MTGRIKDAAFGANFAEPIMLLERAIGGELDMRNRFFDGKAGIWVGQGVEIMVVDKGRYHSRCLSMMNN